MKQVTSRQPTAEQLKEILFDDLCAHAAVSDARYGQVARISGDGIPHAMERLYQFNEQIRDWETDLSVTGPVEVEEQLVYIRGHGYFDDDGTGFVYVVDSDGSYSAKIKLISKYIDMITIYYGSEWDEHDFQVHFIIQVGPLGYAKE